MSKKTELLTRAGSQTQYYVDPNNLVIAGFDNKDDGPLCDKESNRLPVEESMILNIMEFGVLEDVLIRKNGEVVAGRHRTRAAREANKRLAKEGKELIRVPVSIKVGDDSTLMGVLISENNIRRVVGPGAKAREMAKYMAMGRTEDQTAVAYGVSKATVKQYLKFLDLDPKVQKKVEDGDLGLFDALGLSKLSKEEQAAAAEAKVTAKKNGKKAPKVRGEAKSVRNAPSKKEIRAQAQALGGVAQIALFWAIGDIDVDAAMEDKAFAKALAERKKAK